MVLSESRLLRYLTLALFYLSQGVPAGVTIIGIPAWAAYGGASSGTVASLVAAGYLVPSFKFLIGPIVDRYGFPAMGRRRPWLIGAQVVMTLAWLAAAAIAPGPHDTGLLVTVTFLVSGATAVQDVAADGLSVDILEEGEEGPAGSLMFGAAIISMALSGAGSGYLLQHYGSGIAFLAFLPVIALVTIFAIAFRERPGERRFPWSEGKASSETRAEQEAAWLPLLIDAVRLTFRRDSLLFIGMSLATGLAAGITAALWPLFATRIVHMDAAGYTALTSAATLPTTGICILIGGLLMHRLGSRNVLAAIVLLDALVTVWVAVNIGLFAALGAFSVMTVATTFTASLRQMGQQAVRVPLSDPRVGATQMTIYNSLGNFSLSGGAKLFPLLGGIEAPRLVLGIVAALSLLGALLTWLLRVGQRPRASAPSPADRQLPIRPVSRADPSPPKRG